MNSTIEVISNLLINELEAQISKAVRTSAKCIIPSDRLPFFSRLVLLSELLTKNSTDLSNGTQIKRCCKRGYITEIVNLLGDLAPSYPHMQLIHAILTKWPSILSYNVIENMLQRLLQWDKIILKK